MFSKFNCGQFYFLIIPAILSIQINASAGQFSSTRRKKVSCEILNTPGKKFLLDSDSQQCYLVGTRGPCNELMIFYQNPWRKESKYGFCDCDQGFRSDLPCRDNPIRRRVYVHRDKRCYPVFSQGPCKRGEWLVLNEANESGICVPNRCLQVENGRSRDTSPQFWFYAPNRKQCFETLTQGYCPKGLQLELVHDSQYPQCRKKECFSSLVHGIRSAFSCKAGSRFSYFTNACRVSSFSQYRSIFGIG